MLVAQWWAGKWCSLFFSTEMSQEPHGEAFRAHILPKTNLAPEQLQTITGIFQPSFLRSLHSLKLTWHLKIGHPQRKLIFQPSIFRGENVSFREGKLVPGRVPFGRFRKLKNIPPDLWIFSLSRLGLLSDPPKGSRCDPWCPPLLWRICSFFFLTAHAEHLTKMASPSLARYEFFTPGVFRDSFIEFSYVLCTALVTRFFRGISKRWNPVTPKNQGRVHPKMNILDTSFLDFQGVLQASWFGAFTCGDFESCRRYRTTLDDAAGQDELQQATLGFRGFLPWFGWKTSWENGCCTFKLWLFSTSDPFILEILPQDPPLLAKICYFAFLCCQAIQSIPAYSDALLNAAAAHQKMTISQACCIISTHFDDAIFEKDQRMTVCQWERERERGKERVHQLMLKRLEFFFGQRNESEGRPLPHINLPKHIGKKSSHPKPK